MVPRFCDQLVLAHADAGIGDREGARRPCPATMRTAASSGQRERRIGQRLEAAAVDRVGGVGDQLAQEDLALGVERMDHEIEQPPDLGAEFVPFRLCSASLMPRPLCQSRLCPIRMRAMPI